MAPIFNFRETFTVTAIICVIPVIIDLRSNGEASIANRHTTRQ